MKERSKKKDLKKELICINRKLIGSISLNDIIFEEELTPTEQKKYLQDAEMIYNNPVFSNELKKMIQRQLEFIGMESTSQDEVYIARGTMNGFDLLIERFSTLHKKYEQATKPEDTDFDKFNPLPGV
jgi:hypothetical protein